MYRSVATRTSFGQRIAGALRLNPATYEEVEHDSGALGQAAVVVVLSNVATGLAYARGASLVWGPVMALLGWVVWAALIYLIGVKLLPEPQTRSDVRELMRTVGFASAPGLFGVLGLLPILGPVVMFVVAVWMAAATVTAVRHALDFTSVWRALLVVVIGWLVYVALLIIV